MPEIADQPSEDAPLLVVLTRSAAAGLGAGRTELQHALSSGQEHPLAAPAYVALGAVLAAEEVASAALARAGELGAAVAGPARAIGRSRAFAPLAGVLRTLEDRGRREAAAGAAEASAVVEALTARIAQSDAVLRMVNDIVDVVLWPIVDEVLPAVLERLADDPEPVQALVLGNSTRMIDDLAGAARTRTARADDSVASFVDRLLGRRRPEHGEVVAGPTDPAPTDPTPTDPA